MDRRQAAADGDAAARVAASPRAIAVGVTLVKEAVAEWKRQRREVFVPLTYRPGDLAEVDFFEVLVDVDGDAPQGVALSAAADVLRPRLRAGSTSGRIRSAFSTATCARSRTSAACRRGWRTTICAPAVRRILVGGERALTRALRGAGLALSVRAVLLSARRRPRQGRRRSARQSDAPAGAGADSERRRRSTAINAALLAQLDARLETRRDGTGQTIGARFARGAARCCGRCRSPFVAEATTIATVTPRALVARRGRVLLGAVSLGRARSDRRAIGATTVTIVGRDGHAHRPSAQALRRAVDRLPPLPAGAGAEAAGGAAGAAGAAARSRRAVSRRVGSPPRARTARARPRASSPRSSASSRRTAPPSSCRRSRRALATGTPLLLALRAGAAPRRRSRRRVPATLRDLEVAERLRRRLRRAG